MLAEEVQGSGTFSSLNADGSGGGPTLDGVVETLIELPQIKTNQVE